MLGFPRTLACRGSVLVLLLTMGCGSGGSGGTGGASFDPLPLPAGTYSHGEPSGLEQQLLEEMQASRKDPAATGQRIADMPEVQGAIQQFGVDKAKLVADFMTYPPAPPFAFDPHLLQSSRFHSQDMADHDFQEHDGSAGEGFSDRITDAGYEWSFVSENIFAYADSIPYCNAAFLIDWGNPDLGHRKAILGLDGMERDTGVSVIEKAVMGQGSVGPLVVTEDFGQPASDPLRYVVGVVYQDKNENGRYDAGEGVAGMNIVPEGSDTYAVTSQSGGFAVPLNPHAGKLKVQVQTARGVALDEAEVEMTGDNVKVDFIVD